MAGEASGVGVGHEHGVLPVDDVPVGEVRRALDRDPGPGRRERVFVQAVGVELVLRGTLVPEPGHGHDTDEYAEDADADSEERELGRGVALVDQAVLVLKTRWVECWRWRRQTGALEGLVQDVVGLQKVLDGLDLLVLVLLEGVDVVLKREHKGCNLIDDTKHTHTE